MPTISNELYYACYKVNLNFLAKLSGMGVENVILSRAKYNIDRCSIAFLCNKSFPIYEHKSAFNLADINPASLNFKHANVSYLNTSIRHKKILSDNITKCLRISFPKSYNCLKMNLR